MANLPVFCAVASSFLVALWAAPADGAPVGKTSRATQTVTLSGSGRTTVASSNTEVNFLDRITTNGSGIGEFVFNDNSKLAVGPSASVVVDQFVLKKSNSFAKLSLSAAKGSFRWISGRSPSSAYRFKTPRGTMGIRGTAFDLTARGGSVHIVLLGGSARFCNGSGCRTLSRACDYIVADGRSISSAKPVGSSFPSFQAAAKVFPYLANPKLLSSRFSAAGRSCLARVVMNGKGPRTSVAAAGPGEPPAPPPGIDPPGPPPPGTNPPGSGPPGGRVSQAQTCGGNCGVGLGNGANRQDGTSNEGRSNRP